MTGKNSQDRKTCSKDHPLSIQPGSSIFEKDGRIYEKEPRFYPASGDIDAKESTLRLQIIVHIAENKDAVKQITEMMSQNAIGKMKMNHSSVQLYENGKFSKKIHQNDN